MSGSLLGVNTTIKFVSSLVARTSGISSSDTNIVGAVSAGQFALVTGIHVESLGTHTSYTLRVVPSGGTQFPITAAGTTTLNSNMLASHVWIGPGDAIEIAFTGGSGGIVGVTGVLYTNSP